MLHNFIKNNKCTNILKTFFNIALASKEFKYFQAIMAINSMLIQKLKY